MQGTLFVILCFKCVFVITFTIDKQLFWCIFDYPRNFLYLNSNVYYKTDILALVKSFFAFDSSHFLSETFASLDFCIPFYSKAARLKFFSFAFRSGLEIPNDTRLSANNNRLFPRQKSVANRLRSFIVQLASG